MQKNELCEIAKRARENSYSPYSSCRVGAALLCADGNVYTGVNIENAAYSPTICAERSAFSAAITDGKREFSMIAVAGEGDVFPPCGVCRQVMAEFCSADFLVLCVTPEGYREYTLCELLPYAFTPENVKGDTL